MTEQKNASSILELWGEDVVTMKQYGRVIAMITNLRPVSIFFTVALLVGCGGGGGGGGGLDTAAYQQAIDAAVAKEAEARLLAVDAPCDQASQCGTVSFTDPRNLCGFLVYKPYSLISPTAAAAKAASDQQLEMAANARKLSPQPLVACPALFVMPPVLACVASKCQAVP